MKTMTVLMVIRMIMTMILEYVDDGDADDGDWRLWGWCIMRKMASLMTDDCDADDDDSDNNDYDADDNDDGNGW